MSETYDRILRLRAIRSFDGRPLEASDLGAVLEAGRWTGSSKNRQGWSFVVVTDPAQRDALAACGDFTQPVEDAPVTIALIQEPNGNDFDIGRLAQNLMLAADALGLASCPVTLHRSAQAATVLGLPPEAKVRYAIALGYPGVNPSPAKYGGRKPMEELVHRDRY
ncbi:MAG TPA: nitroreductase family protein [Acidimicrobiia bacterium]